MMFERLEAEIFAMEEELETVRAAMLEPENYSDHANMRGLQDRESRLQSDLAAAYERWENWS